MKRNPCIDAVRILAAFFVVCIHIPIYWRPAFALLDPLVDFAVPFFFLTSGYLLFPVESDAKRILDRLWYILRLTALWVVILLAFYAMAYALHGTFDEYCGRLLSSDALYRSLLFKAGIPFAPHLWFLVALIDCYLLALLARALPAIRWIFLWLPTSLLLGLAAKVSHASGFTSALAWVNELLLLAGPPWFFLGRFLAKRLSSRPFCLHPRALLAATGAFALARILIYHFAPDWTLLYALALILLSVGVLLTCIRYPHVFSGSVAARWGRAYSLPVYLLHGMIIKCFSVLAKWFPALSAAYVPAAPLIVFFCSVFIAALWQKLTGWLHANLPASTAPAAKHGA